MGKEINYSDQLSYLVYFVLSTCHIVDASMCICVVASLSLCVGASIAS